MDRGFFFQSSAREARRPKNTPGLSSHLSQQQTMQWICIDGVAAGDGAKGCGWGSTSADVQGHHHIRHMYNHTHKYRHTLVQTTRGHIETTTCTRKHRLHDPSQVAQLEKKKKKRHERFCPQQCGCGQEKARSLHCMQRIVRKAKNQQFPSNRSKRFSENVCHCKTCLHALLAHAGIHSLIAETTKIVYSTEYFVFVCLVNHNCKILSCREMSYIGANNIAFTSAADEPKMHTAVRRSSKP